MCGNVSRRRGQVQTPAVSVQKTTSATNVTLPLVSDYILWYARDRERSKYRDLYRATGHGKSDAEHYGLVINEAGLVRPASDAQRRGDVHLLDGEDFVTLGDLQSAGMGRDKGEGAASWFPVAHFGRDVRPTEKTRWNTNELGMSRLQRAGRVVAQQSAIRY